MHKFVLTITDNRYLGLILEPHIINKTEFTNYDVVSRLTVANYGGFEEMLLPEEKMMVEISEQFSNVNIHNLFCKNKKQSVKAYIQSISDREFATKIKPYIDNTLKSILDIAKRISTEIYYKDSPKISEYDRIDDEIVHCDAVLNMIKTDNEIEYFIETSYNEEKLDLRAGNTRFLSVSPCILLIKNTLYSFEIDGKKLKPFLQKDKIKIPGDKQRVWFDTFGLKNIQQCDVKTSGFEIEDITPERHCKLRLEHGFQGVPVVVPRFVYNGRRFYYNSGAKTHSILLTKDDELVVRKFNRDLKWEDSCVDLINKAGFLKVGRSVFALDYNEKDTDDQKMSDFLSAISMGMKSFRENNIKVVQNFYQKKFCIEEVSIQKDIVEENDWFDLKILVTFGEFSFPFKYFRKHILNDIREFVLPNGETFMLPNEWFIKFKEFFLFTKENEESFMLEKHNISVLDEADLIPESVDIEDTILNIKDHITNLEVEVPEALNAELRHYQFEGFKWMQLLRDSKLGGLLADDMGLGKTIQTITSILSNPSTIEKSISKLEEPQQLSLFDANTDVETQELKKPSLIVMPVSLVYNWKNEIEKFAPSLKTQIYLGGDRSSKIDKIHDYDIILTSYGTLRNDIEVLSEYEYNYLILDESQYIKNPFSKSYKAILKLNAETRLALTGTPIENSLTDLWSQMNFLNDGVLGSLEYFKQQYVNPIEKQNDETVEAKLKRIIEPFLLRRTKEEVVTELPPVSHQIVYCGMSPEQEEVYKEEKNKVRNMLIEEEMVSGNNSVGVNVLAALLKLRQISCHPMLAFPEGNYDSQKFNSIVNDIENIVSENHKVLIFSSFVEHLKLYENYFNNREYSYAMLTGSLSPKQREQQIEKFKSEEECRLFLISLKAGGSGLNLVEADYVFLIDPWWNPKAEEQAIARAHRIGQKRNVMVYRYITVNTIEEKIEKLKQRKSALSDTFINSANPMKSLSHSDIKDIIE